MIESKFKVGDSVYSILRGPGSIIYTDGDGDYPIDVAFKRRHECFTSKGKASNSDFNPTLLTLSEARARGYDVPKETIKKSFVRYGFVYGGGEIVTQTFSEREDAIRVFKGLSNAKGVAKITVEWEEEV